MQEINLLQTRIHDRTTDWSRRNRIFTTVLVLVLVLEAASTGVFYMLKRSNQTKIQETRLANAQIQSELNKRQSDLGLAKGYQAQLQNIKGLISRHVYWSAFFEELSKFTYTKAQYSAIQAGLDGKIHVEGITPTYTDLGKLILGLKTSSSFKNVKLLSAQPSSSEKSGYSFAVDMMAVQDVFKK